MTDFKITATEMKCTQPEIELLKYYFVIIVF
jgi:hypothetical protein